MFSYAWVTDIHLDFFGLPEDVGDQQVIEFCDDIKATLCDVVFITGDISTSGDLVHHLYVMEQALKRPIYYVLGNHDYWYSSFKVVKSLMSEVERISTFTKYLGNHSYMPIGNDTAIIGDDGWYDARNGNFRQSNIILNDWFTIRDFAALPDHPLCSTKMSKPIDMIVTKSRELANISTAKIANGIKEAIRSYKNIIILTHVPPFAEVAVHNGRMSNGAALPWYTNKTLGDALLKTANENPNVNFIVLCGHTHGRFESKFAKNLTVKVGHSDYGNPSVAGSGVYT